MKKILFTLLLALFTIGASQAQNRDIRLYKGTINGKLPVTLFIIAEANECTGELSYMAMYKYDKMSYWLQLDITASHKKSQFAMVEFMFTGLMILKKSGTSFSGNWISPDATTRLKAAFKEVPMTNAEKKRYEDKMVEVNYENYGC